MSDERVVEVVIVVGVAAVAWSIGLQAATFAVVLTTLLLLLRRERIGDGESERSGGDP